VLVRGVVVASRPVRRILSGPLPALCGHPSRPAVARRLQRPTRGSSSDGPSSPCLALLRVGFTEPPGSPRALVRSYRTVSPLPVRPKPPSAVCSLWHCPAGRPDWVLPSTLPCGVRTFLGPVAAGSDRSSRRPRHAAARPTRHQATSSRPDPVATDGVAARAGSNDPGCASVHGGINHGSWRLWAGRPRSGTDAAFGCRKCPDSRDFERFRLKIRAGEAE